MHVYGRDDLGLCALTADDSIPPLGHRERRGGEAPQRAPHPREEKTRALLVLHTIEGHSHTAEAEVDERGGGVGEDATNGMCVI